MIREHEPAPAPAHAVDRWNDVYFDGALSDEVRELLLPLDHATPGAVATAERALRLLHDAHVDARNLSPTVAWQIGAILPGLHPEAWGDIVPPITGEGRLRRLDEYLLKNAWYRPDASYTPLLLDIGCGFPPHTAVDSARALPGWRVVGMDRDFAEYIVDERDVGYAAFDRDRRMRYFQPHPGGAARWDAMFRDRDAVTARYSALLDELTAELPADDTTDATFQTARRDSVSVTRHPVRRYERENLQFVRCGIGDAVLPPDSVDAARCINVFMYFDPAFRAHAIEWAATLIKPGGLFICGCISLGSTLGRYSVYQKVDGRLVPREFAFSVDNIRPTGFMTCYTLHDEEAEVLALVDSVRNLRDDPAFRQRFDPAADAASANAQIDERGSDGYLHGAISRQSTGDRTDRTARVAASLRAMGVADWAVDALRRAGREAWVNCVGDVAQNIIA